MKSSIVKRSIVIAGHKTSVSLEEPFWAGLKEIAKSRAISLSKAVHEIDVCRRHGNLSSAIRLYVLDHQIARLSGLTGVPAGADTRTGVDARNYA